MNADFFFKFTKFRLGNLVNAEDYADKINYQWTSSFLVISTALIAMRQYIFTPIQCWVPPEWPRPWEEYTENYCWIQNTYSVKMGDTNHPDKEARKQLELNYYQWVPFMLALEAMLVYSPHLFWKVITLNSGYNPNAIVKFAADASTIDQDKKDKFTRFVARQIEKVMRHRAQWRKTDTLWLKMQRKCHAFLPCFWFGKRSGTMLFSLYIFNKLIYIGVGFLHLWLMQVFLGFDSLLFGWYCLYDMINGREWQETRVFPRVTFCDVEQRVIANWNTRSVQCVLPVNLLNEKIYIFLWFWTVGCICFSILSLLMWIVRLLVMKNRQHFIKKYLRILNSMVNEDDDEIECRKRFADEFLAYDGIFLLRMIASNVGDVVVADIVDVMYKNFAQEDKGEQQQQQPPQTPIKRKQSGVSQRRPTSANLAESDSFLVKKSQV